MRIGIAPIYGYLICLVAVITFLVSLGTLISASFDLTDPLYARGGFEQHRSLSSLENYRLDAMRNLPPDQVLPDEAAIQAMFDAARDAQIRAVRLEALRSIWVSGLLIIVSIALFITHMRWLRHLPNPPDALVAAAA